MRIVNNNSIFILRIVNNLFIIEILGDDDMVFKRKIYNRLLQWKEESQGSRALLIEGARRIGKSTIVEEFARNEYRSYLMIDFAKATEIGRASCRERV